MLSLLSTFFLVGLCCSSAFNNTLDHKQIDNESNLIVSKDSNLPKSSFGSTYNLYLSMWELGSVNVYYNSLYEVSNFLGTGFTGQHVLETSGTYNASPSIYSSGMCGFYYVDRSDSYMLKPFDSIITSVTFLTHSPNEFYTWRFGVVISDVSYTIDIDILKGWTISSGERQTSWSYSPMIYDSSLNVPLSYTNVLPSLYLYVNLNVWGSIFSDLGDDYQAGYSNGYASGYDEGLIHGRDESQTQAYNNGYDNGYQDGYDGGLAYALEQGTTASTIFTGIIDVGLLPVNVFLAMLNFEVFGINISGLVSAFLTISIVVIIIRFVLGAKNDK